MTTTGHTVTAFDDDLGQLRALVAEMGGLAEAAIADAMRALTRRDTGLAARIVNEDKRIDDIEVEIETQAVRLIALRAPMADDLRDVVAAMKIASVIERIGDYAKNIAKRVPILADAHKIESLAIIAEMGKGVRSMVKLALDSFGARDAELAVEVNQSDHIIDDFYNSIFRALLTYMMENPHNITTSAHLLFIAKNLERIGDHATNIAEMVYFAARGTYMEERQRGGTETEAGAGQ